MAATMGVASAQTDVTPKAYHFNEAQSLPVLTDLFYGAANPDANFWYANNLAEKWNDGLITIGGNGFHAGNKAAAENIAKTVSLVDLGGTVGKVFCFAHYQSNAKEGLKAATGYDYDIPELAAGCPWFHFNFYLDPTTPTKSAGYLHVKVTYNVYSPAFEGRNTVTKLYASTDQNGVRPIQADANASTPLDYQKCFAENPDTEEMEYDPTAWIEYEWDVDVPDPDTEGGINFAPLRLKAEYGPGWSNGTCLFIKDITITHIPDAEKDLTGNIGDRSYKLVRYEMGEPGTTGVANVAAESEALKVSVNGNSVNFSEAATVYTIAGVKVADAAAIESIELANGFYVAVAGEKAVKFAVK